MGIFDFLYKKTISKNRIDYLYKHPDLYLLVEIEFANRTEKKKKVWVELSCVEFELDALTEYKIVTHDRFFRIDFYSDDSIIFYLQYSFGFKLYKRSISKEIPNSNDWVLDHDTSNIN